MNSPFRSRSVVIALSLMAVLSACGADPAPAEESAVQAQQKMYLSFEATLTGKREFGEQVPADALADVAWRINRSVKGEIVLDMPLPGSIPPSIASDNSMEMMEEGRFTGWTAALPDDPDVIEKMMTGKLNVASNPMFVPAEFSIDDEVHHRSRDFPSEPFGTTRDQTFKGRGKVYISRSAIVSCDLKGKICDISGLLESGYTDDTDLVTIAENPSDPGDQGERSTMNPGIMLPKIGESFGDRLAGIEFQMSGLITTSFSEPHRDTFLPMGGDAAPVLTVSVNVSPKPAPDINEPR